MTPWDKKNLALMRYVTVKSWRTIYDDWEQRFGPLLEKLEKEIQEANEELMKGEHHGLSIQRI